VTKFYFASLTRGSQAYGRARRSQSWWNM